MPIISKPERCLECGSTTPMLTPASEFVVPRFECSRNDGPCLEDELGSIERLEAHRGLLRGTRGIEKHHPERVPPESKPSVSGASEVESDVRDRDGCAAGVLNLDDCDLDRPAADSL